MKTLIYLIITLMILCSCSEGRLVAGNDKHLKEWHYKKLRMDSIKLAKNEKKINN